MQNSVSRKKKGSKKVKVCVVDFYAVTCFILFSVKGERARRRKTHKNRSIKTKIRGIRVSLYTLRIVEKK